MIGVLLLVYSVAIVAASLVGGALPSWVRLTHLRMQCMLSFVGGLMLGIGLLHLVPHAFAQTGSLDWTLGWALAGLLVMFFLIRTFHFHHHGPAALGEAHGQHHALAGGSLARPPESSESSADFRGPRGAAPLSWLGVALGLALHTLLDGLALAAAVQAEDAAHPKGILKGFAVFLAILLHKPLDALSITTLMTASGWSPRARQSVNFGFALMCPLGAWLSALGFQLLGDRAPWTVGAALGFSGGVFLCISLSDLLPEVQFHRHDRALLSGALALGILVAVGVGHLEPEHAHAIPRPPATPAPRHTHDHDDDLETVPRPNYRPP